MVVLGLHLPKVGNNGGKKSMNISITQVSGGECLRLHLHFASLFTSMLLSTKYHLHVFDHNNSLLVIFLIGKVLLHTCIYTLPKYN